MISILIWRNLKPLDAYNPGQVALTMKLNLGVLLPSPYLPSKKIRASQKMVSCATMRAFWSVRVWRLMKTARGHFRIGGQSMCGDLS